MKKIVLILALILASWGFLCPNSFASQHDKLVCVNDTANATFEVVGGVASERLYVKRVIISVADAGNYKLQCNGVDLFGPVYLGANGGYDATLSNVSCPIGAAEDLDAVKSTAGNDATFCIQYDQF